MTRARRIAGRLREFVAARLDPKAHLGLHLTVVLLAGVAAVWVFGALLDAVLDNATIVRLDIGLDAMIRERVTPGGIAFFKAATHLGDPATIAGVALAGAIALWIRGHRAIVVGWIAAFAGAELLERVLKLAVHRNRPIRGAEYLHSDSFSFPSGHSMGIVIGVGMVLHVAGLYWRPPRWVRRTLVGLGLAIIILVGVSRIYLGVHYPSDVLGGFAAAAGWMSACISAETVAREEGLRHRADSK